MIGREWEWLCMMWGGEEGVRGGAGDLRGWNGGFEFGGGVIT